MKIYIKNYNNIKELEYKIKDKKINFLFGISGSGKSSIAAALTDEEIESHIPYNINDKPTIFLNDKDINYNDNRMFNSSYMNNILIDKKDEEDIYNILFSDDQELIQIKEEYNTSINCLFDIKEKIYGYYGKINKLLSDLKIEYTKSGDRYLSSCLINKIVDNTKKEKYSYIKNKHLTSKEIKWFIEGTNFAEYLKGKCPFCNKNISNNRKKIIDKMIAFDAKTYEKISSDSNILKDLSIDEPNWLYKREVSKFNKKIKEYYNVYHELDKIINYINCANNVQLSVNDFKPLKISKSINKLMPEISQALNEFNNKYKDIRNKIIKIRVETDKLIGKHIKEINNILNLLGIQYIFCNDKIDGDGKKASFIIKSAKDKNNVDRASNLSYGEKNIIGLILFLFANKNKKCLIIDDPASSYDEYRRKVIFDILYSIKNPNSTYLVLSHDHVFAKYACYYLYKASKDKTKNNKYLKYKEGTGNVDFIETYGNVNIIKEIKHHHFQSISYFIYDRIQNLDKKMNYQMALNLRLFFEINRSKKYHNIIYGYLSQIIHEYPYKDIIDNLKKHNKTEDQILCEIKNIVDCEIEKLSSNYLKEIKFDNFSNFEKILYSREHCNNSKKGRIIKDELNNIIHMNQAYAICLNPYKFNYYSNYVYDYITNDLRVTL